MASASASLSGSDRDVNPTGWEDSVCLVGSYLDSQLSGLDNELRKMLRDEWEFQENSDVILHAREREFRVHRLVLVAHSPYLKQKVKQSKITLDLEADVLHLFLKFLYDGKVDVPRGKIRQLKDAAQLLEVDLLKRQCQYALLANEEVSTENCLEAWVTGQAVKDEDMASKGLKVALEGLHGVQYTSQFMKLSFQEIQEYLLHPKLRVDSPDEKFSAALQWGMNEPETRIRHLGDIFDNLPLTKMQTWLLKSTLHNPKVAQHKYLRRRLEQALKEQARQTKGKEATKDGEVLSNEKTVTDDPRKQQCLVFVGHCVYEGDTKHSPSDEVMLCLLEKEMEVRSMGKVGADFVSSGTKLVVDGTNLYIGGTGKSYDEMWEFCLLNNKAGAENGRLLGRLNTPRQGHAMCMKDGLIYILGGRDAGSTKTSTPSVEVFDPKTGSSTVIGALEYYNIYDSQGLYYNLACCLADDGETLIVCGAFDKFSKNGQTQYQHTIQLFSLSTKSVTHSVALRKAPEDCVYSIFPVDKDTYIIFAGYYTAVITSQQIESNQIDKRLYRDKFIIPNFRCALALSPDKKYVLLFGGEAYDDTSTPYYAYRAFVADILNDTGTGWEKMKVPWPVGKCWLYAYQTICMARQ